MTSNISTQNKNRIPPDWVKEMEKRVSRIHEGGQNDNFAQMLREEQERRAVESFEKAEDRRPTKDEYLCAINFLAHKDQIEAGIDDEDEAVLELQKSLRARSAYKGK